MLKFSQAISCVTVKVKTNISEISSMPIIRVDDMTLIMETDF
jgi:hypothetical protein